MTEKTRKVLHSSAKDDWGTPQWLFDKLHHVFNFTIDLCASSQNALLPRWSEDIGHGDHVFCLDKSGQPCKDVEIDWEKEVFFCNPPYGRQLPKILQAIPGIAKGVFLLPSRTGARWFKDAVIYHADVICFLDGRLTFKGAVRPAPFDSVLIVMGIFDEDGDAEDPYMNYSWGFCFDKDRSVRFRCSG